MKIQHRTLNIEDINTYCDLLREKKRREETIKAYNNTLMELFIFLPANKNITHEIMNQWILSLKEQGLSNNTIKHRISIVNNFLKYINGNYITREENNTQNVVTVEISRNEYYRLLQTAKSHDNRKTYLLIKVFGTIGLTLQELSNLTVESVKEGYISSNKSEYLSNYFIPTSLQNELLSYAADIGINKGAIFLNRNGKPIDRTYVTKLINKVCKDARVSEEKANPRHLRKLCKETQNKIYDEFIKMAQGIYNKMIESEQDIYGWDQHL